MDAHICSALDKHDGQKPVYEAYSIRLPLDSTETNRTTKLLGITGRLNIAEVGDAVVSEAERDSDQSDLATMHLDAIEQFRARHKRTWPSRIIRGNGRSYEQDLDKRCKKLPLKVQEAIHSLLQDKAEYTSSRYRTRTYTVAVMRERERYRFSQSGHAAVKQHKHKMRFWKTKSVGPEGSDYLVVIRGVETKACKDEKGFARMGRYGNPWREVDEEEKRQRGRDARRRVHEERQQRRYQPPSYRSRSRSRSYSPPSDRDPEVRARRYISRSRACARSPPPMERPFSSLGESCFYRPRPRTPSPFRTSSYYPPPPPPPFTAPRPQYRPQYAAPPPPPPLYNNPTPTYAPHHFGLNTHNCTACDAIFPCSHFPRRPGVACTRPITSRDGIISHPPCFICMARDQRPASFGPPYLGPMAIPTAPMYPEVSWGPRYYPGPPPLPSSPPPPPPPPQNHVINLSCPAPGPPPYPVPGVFGMETDEDDDAATDIESEGVPEPEDDERTAVAGEGSLTGKDD